MCLPKSSELLAELDDGDDDEGGGGGSEEQVHLSLQGDRVTEPGFEVRHEAID